MLEAEAAPRLAAPRARVRLRLVAMRFMVVSCTEGGAAATADLTVAAWAYDLATRLST